LWGQFATIAGDDLLVASSWSDLAHIEGVEREKYSEGLRMAEVARLALIRGKAGPHAVAAVERGKALILMREGKAAQAIALLESALEKYQQSGSQSKLSDYLAALGDAKSGDGKYEAAVVDYRIGLANLESLVGPEHPDNIFILNNLAVALKHLGKLDEAREALERSLRLSKKAYGPVHRGHVRILVNLGNVVRREGNYAQARKLLKQAIGIGEQVLRPGHPLVSKAILNLGIVLVKEGNYPGAVAQFSLALQIAQKYFSGDHPDVAMALNNVGEALLLEKNYVEAEGYTRRALDMKQRLFGKEHPKVAGSMATLGQIVGKLGRVKEADALLRHALQIYVSAVGKHHPQSIGILKMLRDLHDSAAASRQSKRGR